MDPATITGLVLGVVPLLISAVENYEVTFQPFVTYRRYAKEVLRFTAKLETQRTIFHNECELLLQAVGQNLPDILRDPYHLARRDEQLSKRLQDLLGSSYGTCVLILKLINDTLDEVTEETKGFGDLFEKKKSKGKSTFSHFRQKVKISFSKNRLTDIVNELRDYNKDLQRLSNQIRKLNSNSIQPPQLVTATVISHLQITQEASSRLYEILASRWACDDRVEHVASMSLKVEEKCQNSASKVRFSLAVTCIQPSVRCTPLWLVIESAPSDRPRERPSEKQAPALQNTLQKIGALGRVQIALPSSTMTTSIKMSSSSISQLPGGAQVDLCAMGRLCRYFRQAQNHTALEPCMGYLEKTKTFKHFVYRNSPAQPPADDSKSVSLKEILHSATADKKEVDWVGKLRLARLLALAVLRFHGTKWLPESWGSNDVRFKGHEASINPAKLLDSPCFDAKLFNPTTAPRQIEHPYISASGLAANETLFNLGVVLIELGYNTPFEKLNQSTGLQVETHSPVAEFLAARRLGESVHKEMNPTYGRLVEKCLICNFGVATKLDNTELQSAVVVQVVNQLDICLEQYRDFNSLAPLPANF